MGKIIEGKRHYLKVIIVLTVGNENLQVYQRKVVERQKHIQQLQLLKKYLGCKKCGSLAIDAYSLYENSQLICQPCRMKKEGGSSSPISFLEKEKWFKRFWKIDLVEWLENYDCLPVNKNCADEWLRDKGHLENCRCLEQESQKLYSLVKDNLRRYQEKLKDCQCKISEKVREAEVENIKQALKGKLPAEIEEDTEELFERSKEIQKDIHQFFEGYSDEEIKQLKDPKQIESYEK
ncbi:9193_t:CDS:2 [Cetraspora pellucida]|uniref:9193_t:CDS:1 n=1 Tax=Cetraspora pellucida TaxID=1433469 RepID=A0ACA9KNE1_9GLOM|nr:9193_t:CDS:2 [Cetraspora pellucida]